MPTTGCTIPPGQRAWANILLAGPDGPLRVDGSINRTVASTGRQRSVAVPGNGTWLERLVRLRGVGPILLRRVVAARRTVGTSSFTDPLPGDRRGKRGGGPART